MSYQVLARKWRPRHFAEVVGQEHVLRPLVNALDHDRLHHAFLFTGTRGVGKTTIARILAKCLNCESGPTSKPCGTCNICVAVDEGRFVDLIEVDAASRTKVDETRELLDNVQYAPTQGRYKVYLIDEVHMLSTHSFNALLKTLEEPPPHVKFLLATTDPQRLPVTVLSRCLQFNLKRLYPEQIARQLGKILEQEQVAYDENSLQLLARAADGSLRDALSLLDQAVAHGGGRIAEAEVRALLGTIDAGHVRELVAALAQQDADRLLATVAGLAERTPDFAAVLNELLLCLYHIALAQVAPQALVGDDRDWIAAMAQQMPREDVQLYYQIGLIGKRDLPLAPDPRSGFEMVLLRMLAFQPAQAQASGAARTNTPAAVNAGAAAAVRAGPPPQAADIPGVAESPPAPAVTGWRATVEQLGIGGLVRELAMHAVLEAQSADEIGLVLDEMCRHLHNKEREAALCEALVRHFGAPLKLRIRIDKPVAETPAREKRRLEDERQHAAVAAIEGDPVVQAMTERFGATVIPDSIRPKT